MKRFLLFVFTFSFCLTVSPQSKGFSRWSFAPEYGYNLFNGDFNQNLLKIIPSSLNDITYGAAIECALTPTWGLALNGYCFPLRTQSTSPVALYMNTNLYTADLSATLNFTRLIFPQTKSKLYFNGSVGIGYGYYAYDLKYSNGTVVPTTDTYFDVEHSSTKPIHLLDASGVAPKYGLAVSVPVTFSIEYNFSNPVSVGAKLHYRVFAKDDLEGTTYQNNDGVANDYVAAATLFLRYKLGTGGKGHLRNIQMDVYEPDKGLLLAKELEGKLNKLSARVDTVENKVDSLIPRVARLENILSTDGPDADGDGVPDVRDKDPKTPANTPVDFWGKPLIMNYAQGGSNTPLGAGYSNDANKNRPASVRQAIYIPDDVPSVYFDFDQIDLDDAALITISKIASKMKADPTLYVEVRGYCDYSGNNPYNNLLSQRRSDRVKAELMKVWGIPFDHVISNGKGKVIEPRTKYRPNRRCDFFFGRL
ncbi:MAG: OmpA family protein [Paludibacter sp.]